MSGRVDPPPPSAGIARALRAELARSRAARWALATLGLVVLVALAAPLLPLPAPAAIELERAFEPPLWALWEREPAGASAAASGERRVLGGLFDDGWRHRTVIDVECAGESDLGAALDRLVGETSGRAARRTTSELAPGRWRHRFTLPFARDDRARVDWRASGREGEIVAFVCYPRDERPRAWLALALPVEPERVVGSDWSLRDGRLELDLVLGADPPVAERQGYTCELELPPDVLVDGIELAGKRVDRGAEAGDRAEWLALHLGETLPRELGTDADSPSARIERRDEAGGEPRVLAERVRVSARERVGRTHADLAARVAGAIEARDLAARADLRVAEIAIDEHSSSLSRVDRALLRLRARTFGTWQSGPLLGRDSKGRDLLARVVWGSRTSLAVALAAALTSLLIGVAWGSIAGLSGGRTDEWMMRVVDVLYALPFVFVVIFLITVLDEYRAELHSRLGVDREVLLYLVIGAVWWLTMARVVRGQVLALARSGFVEAARVMGASRSRILFTHVLPNVLPIVVVYLTLTIPQVMLFEAFLSFLGLGVEEPGVSWGSLASEALEAISPLRVFWWLVLFPSLAMAGTLLALNVLGDSLRDALDPKGARS